MTPTPKRKPLNEIRKRRDHAQRVTGCRDLLADLATDRAAMLADRDLAAVNSVVYGGHTVSEVVARMGEWRTSFIKAARRVKNRYPNPGAEPLHQALVSPEKFGYPPRTEDPWADLKRIQGKIDKLDAYMADVRAVRDAGCQHLANQGLRNFQISELAGVSSSYVSQMGLDRPVTSITSAQQAKKALRAAEEANDTGRILEVRARITEKAWAV